MASKFDCGGRDVGYLRTNNEKLEVIIDAAGRRIVFAEFTWNETYSIWDMRWRIAQSYDGDGQRVIQQENGAPWPTYFMRSTVLGGAVVIEINRVNGSWLRDGFVYALDEMVARQKQGASNVVEWNYENPLTGAKRGAIQTEPDHMGMDHGLSQRQPNPPIYAGGSGIMDPGRYADVFNTNYGCTLNGAPTSCEVAMNCLSSEGCEVEDTRPRQAPVRPSPMSPSGPARGHGASPNNSLPAGSSPAGTRQSDSASAPARRPRIAGSPGHVNNPHLARRPSIALPAETVLIPIAFDGTVNDDVGPTPLAGSLYDKWKSERNRLLDLLKADDVRAGISKCRDFLERKGFDLAKIVENLQNQVPFDPLRSTNDANEDFGESGITVKSYFSRWRKSKTPIEAATGYTGRIYYFSNGIYLASILHETIHASHKGSGERLVYDPNNPASDETTGVYSLGPGSMLLTVPRFKTGSESIVRRIREILLAHWNPTVANEPRSFSYDVLENIIDVLYLHVGLRWMGTKSAIPEWYARCREKTDGNPNG